MEDIPTKKCPKCASRILEAANVCPVCQRHIGHWGTFVNVSQVIGLAIAVTAAVLTVIQTRLANEARDDALATYQEMEQAKETSMEAMARAEAIVASLQVIQLDLIHSKLEEQFQRFSSDCGKSADNTCLSETTLFMQFTRRSMYDVQNIVDQSPDIMEAEVERFWNICNWFNMSRSFWYRTDEFKFVPGHSISSFRDNMSNADKDEIYDVGVVKKCTEDKFRVAG